MSLRVQLSSAPAAAQVSVSVGIGTPRVGGTVIVGAPPVYLVDPFYDPYYYYPYPYYRYPAYYGRPLRYGRAYYPRRVVIRESIPAYYYGTRGRYYGGGPRGARGYRGAARYGRSYPDDVRYSRRRR